MTKCATGAAAICIGLFWLMACGGKSQSGADGSAGAQNSAGSSNIGGAGGPATAGAPSVSACSLPQAPGPCDAYEPSFWHNPQTGVCEPFVYGGCQGNANRFATRDDCIAQCAGGGGNDWASCTSDWQCTVLSLGCCSCEPIQAQQLIALNAEFMTQQQAASCSGGAACAPCQAVTEYDATLKYFKPVCKSNQCTLIDVRESPLTECKTESDCVIRSGVNCCDYCSDSGFVPVNKSADFCDGAPTPCPACVPTGGEQYRAGCNSGGHCALNPPLR